MEPHPTESVPFPQAWSQQQKQKRHRNPHRAIRCRLLSLKTVRPASNTSPYALPLQLTPPGTLTAHEKFCLVLLCSQPDTVHRHPLRKTQTSTPLIKGSHTDASPRPDITPAIADFRYRGPLLPRLHGLNSILFFTGFVNPVIPFFAFIYRKWIRLKV